MEGEAPEPREDGQLIHLSEALDAVAMEVEDTQVEESGQDLVGEETESQARQASRAVLRTDWRMSRVWLTTCFPPRLVSSHIG